MNFKSLIILFQIFIVTESLFAQKQASNWINHKYIFKFTESGIIIDTISNPYYNSALLSRYPNSISDEKGNLLFYYYSNRVFNRKHEVMLNGENMVFYDSIVPLNSSLYENLGFISITVPKPGNENLYYIFMQIGKAEYNYSKVCFAIIDMDGDNGYGEVVEKNNCITKFTTLGLTATYHNNMKDVWLASNFNYDTIHTFLINENGIQKPIKSTTGFQSVKKVLNYSDYSVKMRFSPDGKKLYYIYDWSSKDLTILDSFAFVIYDFDNETGKLSNPIFIHSNHKDNTSETLVYNAEFTSDSRYLFVFYVDYRNETFSTYICRYDLYSKNASIIEESVIEKTNSFTQNFHLAIDGNIYGAGKAIYNSTEKEGFCIVESPVWYQPNLNFISNYFERYSTNDEIQMFSTCENKPTVVFSKLYSSPDSFSWNFNDINNSKIISNENPAYHIYVDTGHYSVILNRYYGDVNCQLKKEVKIKTISRIEIDTTICVNNPIKTIDGRIFSKSGEYFDTLTNYLGCDSIIKINLTSNPIPMLDLGRDTILCLNESSLILESGNSDQSILWMPTYETTPQITVTFGGYYNVTVINQYGCKNMDSILVTNNCEGNIFIPNAFSPNGNDLNETFMPITSLDFTDYLFIVYNRWGQEVFRTTDQTIGWDGTFKNKECPEGVYLYIINYKSSNDSFKNASGNITLLR